MIEADYVVVGGGSAGCALAGRLSEDQACTVAVLEAGSGGDSWVVRVPMAGALMVPTSLNNWAFRTEPQPGLGMRRGYQPRGRTLGGSSAINAMVYMRGHPGDYDDWAAQGAPGWSYADLLPHFRRSEHNEDFAGDAHGRDGPLNVARLRTDNPYHALFLQAAREAGYPLRDDFNAGDPEGLGIYQVTQKDGERCSAARAYLLPHLGRRPNLRVECGVHAHRVLFDARRAVGVEFERDGRIEIARARREVILSCGALQTPQLLMLSGIGDAQALGRLGLGVLHDLPGVGRNLQDHPDFVFGFAEASTDLVGISIAGGLRLAREIRRYRAERRGMVATNYAEMGGFLRTRADLARPDIQLHFVVAIVEDHARRLRAGHGYSLHVCLLRPRSRGTLALASADPRDAPRIDPNFLGDPQDLEDLVAGYRLARRLLDAPALASRRRRDLYTGGITTDEQIRDVLRRRVDTIYHPVGTCRMGLDPQAVVDPELRVRGVDALRVADASIMPTLIGGNTNATAIVIGEKAAALLRGRC